MSRGKYQKKRKPSFLPIFFFLIILALAVYFIVSALSGSPGKPTEPPESTPPVTTQKPTETTQPPTTEPTAEPTTVPTEPYVVSTASVGVSGDVLIHSPVYNAAYRNGVYDFNSMFSYIGQYYERYDFMIANLEVTLAGESRGYSSYPQFNCPETLSLIHI